MRWREWMCEVERVGVSGEESGCVRWREWVCQVERVGVSGGESGCVRWREWVCQEGLTNQDLDKQCCWCISIQSHFQLSHLMDLPPQGPTHQTQTFYKRQLRYQEGVAGEGHGTHMTYREALTCP